MHDDKKAEEVAAVTPADDDEALIRAIFTGPQLRRWYETETKFRRGEPPTTTTCARKHSTNERTASCQE
jgi:hypothetical protein